MAFTLAHPAAVIPLYRRLGRFGVLSALVIGSLAPDLHYFFPFQPARAQTHSLAGLWWYCLPVGMALYVAYHRFLKLPLVLALPASAFRRLAHFASPRLPNAPWTAVLISLLVGASTHLAWDAFTHNDGPVVLAVPLLQAPLFTIRAHPIYVYQLLQHLSTVLGMGAVAWWTRRWWRGAPLQPSRIRPLGPSARALAWLCLIGVPTSVALVSIIGFASEPITLWLLRHMLSQAVAAAFPILGPALFAYAIAWHLWSRPGCP
jgi:hypothetical protein